MMLFVVYEAMEKGKENWNLYIWGQNVCKISMFVPLSSDFLVTKWASKECELCDELYKMQMA